MKEKKEASLFKRKYKIRVVNSATLCEAITAQGFTVIEFNGISDDEDTVDLINALHLRDYILTEKCFTYQNDKYRLVFIHEDLNEEERMIVFAHEEGHIWNGHMAHNSMFGTDVKQEYEANEFAHFLLDDKNSKKKRIKIAAVVCLLLLLIGAGTGFLMMKQHEKAVYTNDYYRTATGTKYHLRDCMYIKDKTNIYRLTREEFESGEYESCGACIPGRTTDHE